jgi:hypothetical protein
MNLSKLKIDLFKHNIELSDKHDFINFSDYVILHNSNIIAFGWIAENSNTPLSFNGYVMNSNSFKNYVTNPFPSIMYDNGKDVTDFFQFYLSDSYLWYAPPINTIIGYSCIPINESVDFIIDINKFIDCEYSAEEFRKLDYDFKFEPK